VPVPRTFGRSWTAPDARWPAKRPGRISVIRPANPEKPESRHDAVVDEDQRRDLLRRVEDEVRRVSREHGWDSPQARAERQRQLGLERSTAAELGLPYAQRVDVGVRWDAGAPMPVLLSGLRTFVAFYLSARDPLFGGTDPRVRDPHADHGIGIVEFKRVTSVKIGSPNDEVLRGHPLWGSGLEFYSAHEVKNSPWITELMEMNRAHERFDESQWSGRRHFMLTFHDETLECVAKWTITRTAPGATMPEVLARLSAEAL
jgi:hypothetical protein